MVRIRLCCKALLVLPPLKFPNMFHRCGPPTIDEEARLWQTQTANAQIQSVAVCKYHLRKQTQYSEYRVLFLRGGSIEGCWKGNSALENCLVHTSTSACNGYLSLTLRWVTINSESSVIPSPESAEKLQQHPDCPLRISFCVTCYDSRRQPDIY